MLALFCDIKMCRVEPHLPYKTIVVTPAPSLGEVGFVCKKQLWKDWGQRQNAILWWNLPKVCSASGLQSFNAFNVSQNEECTKV